MRSPITKYKRLGFLLVTAFVLVVFTIAVAQNDSGDSTQGDVPAIQPIDQNMPELSEDLTQEDVPATQPADQTTQEQGTDSEQKEVPAAQPDDLTTTETNVDSEQENAQPPLKKRKIKKIRIDFLNTTIVNAIG